MRADPNRCRQLGPPRRIGRLMRHHGKHDAYRDANQSDNVSEAEHHGVSTALGSNAGFCSVRPNWIFSLACARSFSQILWESKRTKNWSEGWLAKLRGDQRAAGADIAVLASKALPRGIDTFACVDGIWITEPRFAMPLAIALRQMLIEVAKTRQAQDGQATKMELVYQYLTSRVFGIALRLSLRKSPSCRRTRSAKKKDNETPLGEARNANSRGHRVSRRHEWRSPRYSRAGTSGN
jgi:Uncharacterized protein conserved in bacteria (DUF2130)